jgi:predicted DsbA family dithiol-disulfide isomerase
MHKMIKPSIKLGVVSDVVCPWCYIGKRRLEKALDKLSDKYDFEIEYFPFELNPQMPAEGANQKQYLMEKFGGEERYQQITNHTTSVAAQEGLTFNFDKQERSPNTRNAHRLIQLAKEDGKHLQLTESLFKAYFTDGVDLSKNDNLIAVAESVGMDKEKVSAFLESNTGVTEIEMAEQELQKIGISGVPFYIIENKYGISGAQPTETFINAFEEIAASKLTVIATDPAQACDVDKRNC